MPRPLRRARAGLVYHILNRANARSTLFRSARDYLAFEKTLEQAHQRLPIDLFSYCLMPNHWHLVLRPHRDSDLSNFLRWLTLTHTQRYHAAHHTSGTGHLYQGRFKSFPVQDDRHFLILCRYVERNPLRAALADDPALWKWSSFHRRSRHDEQYSLLADWPVDRPPNWSSLLSRPQSPHDEQSIRTSISRGRPFGAEPWQHKIAKSLHLQHTFRPRGRPPESIEKDR